MTQPLRDVIHVLTRPHIPAGETRAIYAEPLLDTLHSLITPSGSQKGSDGGGGGGGSRPPISLEALTLWQDINRTVDREWPYAGHPSAVRVPLGRKLQAWHSNAVEPHQQARLHKLCTRWEANIREALEPTKKMPLSGSCPQCEKTHVETTDEDGAARYNPALLAFPGAQPVYAICQVCETKWEGKALHELAERIAA